MIIFGAGDLWIKESTGTTPKAIRAAKLRGVTCDISQKTIDLYANRQFPIDVANGEGALTGKITLGEIQPVILAMILPSMATTTGYEQMVTDPPTAYAATVTVVGATGFKEDYGVQYSDTKADLTRVSSVTAAGQYSVNESTGVYSFHSGDSGKNFDISYAQTISGSGNTYTATNQLMGAGVTYKLRAWNVYGGKKIGIYLPAIKINKGSINQQFNAHATPDHDFTAFQSSEVGADGNFIVFKMFSA